MKKQVKWTENKIITIIIALIFLAGWFCFIQWTINPTPRGNRSSHIGEF